MILLTPQLRRRTSTSAAASARFLDIQHFIVAARGKTNNASGVRLIRGSGCTIRRLGR